jgi:type 1 glutamine amidotransferase
MTRNLLLVGGPGHEFDDIAEALDGLFVSVGIETTVVTHPDDMMDKLRSGDDDYDLLTVHALHWGMDAERYAHLREDHAYSLSRVDAGGIRDFVERGGGLLALHTAVICFDAEPIWHELCGAAWHWERSTHPEVAESEVVITEQGRAHPITTGVEDFRIVDEVYGFLDESADLEPLLVGSHGGRTHPLLWARSHRSGRVVTDLLGHDVRSIDHPVHGSILQQAAVWAAGGRANAVETSGNNRTIGKA